MFRETAQRRTRHETLSGLILDLAKPTEVPASVLEATSKAGVIVLEVSVSVIIT